MSLGGTDLVTWLLSSLCADDRACVNVLVGLRGLRGWLGCAAGVSKVI